MKNLIATIALALVVPLGGTVAAAGPANAADDCPLGVCTPAPPPCEPFTPCGPQPPVCEPFTPCPGADVAMLEQRLFDAEQTANDYRVQVATLTARLERVEKVAARRAATIQQLRARIRDLT